jgi:predicted nucleotidyltransferase
VIGRMVDERVLQQAVKRIVAAAQPSRVILFGSQGRGDADSGSDLDLMLIKPDVADK